MNLHTNPKLFEQAVRATAQQKGIREIYIEKDYWVTYALSLIFKSAIGKEVVFKGGTSLNKCYKIIDRFSEDIDLVVLQSEGESANQLKNKLKSVTKIVAAELPEIETDGITQKRGMNRKTFHTYPKQFKGNFGQIRDGIVLEATVFGSFDPYHKTEVSSFIFDMMNNNKQVEIAEEYSLLPFELNVLDIRRTFCEKIMSLVRFSYSENPIADLKMKIRHTYDLHLLLKSKEIKSFINSESFKEMLNNVANDDVKSFKNNNDWLKHHPKDALFFSDLVNVWERLSSTYQNEFSELVYGELPDKDNVLNSLKKIKKHLAEVNYLVVT